MDRRPLRRFTLVDAIALVAATAAGMGWIHANYARQFFSFIWEYSFKRGDYAGMADSAIRAAWPFLLAWTLAALVLRLRRPRPARGRLARQPGLVASAATTMATAATFWPTLVGIAAGIPRFDGPTGYPSRFWAEIATGGGSVEAIGLAVTAAWMTLALGRRWRPEPSWIDRLGRILGACWIALFAARGVLHVTRVLWG